jgi:hypothetical protein
LVTETLDRMANSDSLSLFWYWITWSFRQELIFS